MESVERLRCFIEDMLEWETSFGSKRRAHQREMPDDQEGRLCLVQDNREKLLGIFEKHLSSSALATTAQARLSTMGTARPPEYAQLIVEGTEAQVGKKVYIETYNEKSIVSRRRYSMVFDGEDSRVDAIYAWRESSDKWEKMRAI
ncbi:MULTISPECIES: NTF2 fold immunity protein [Pseudomonas]|uniref:NTF2 fold immunity protein domain-containing protein n=1 Tax=Pseudomonas entomophila TaxID=312306 RepID=A0A3Q8TXH0_9PSED|nr:MULTISPECIES: NTF2 fold immunity protein [Pseudomonas]AZL70625.1 hypothetical protein EJA05_24100 [Pseudomonas oryziphila]